MKDPDKGFSMYFFDREHISKLIPTGLATLRPAQDTGMKVVFIPEEFDVDWDTMKVKKRGPSIHSFYGVNKDTNCEEMAYQRLNEKNEWEDSTMEKYIRYINKLIEDNKNE